MSKKFKVRVDLGEPDMFYKFTSVFCGVEVVYWCIPAYVGGIEGIDWEFWAIADEYVDKDKNGNPRKVCAPLHQFIRGATLEDCRSQCDDMAHAAYLRMRGMTRQEAARAVSDFNKRKEGLSNE